MAESIEKTIEKIHSRLWAAYGPQQWWPAQTSAEVVVGAILTQNTAWRNVERAIQHLKENHCLTWGDLGRISEERLAELIRPSGTYRVKAARIKAFVGSLWDDHRGSLEAMLEGEIERARERLLAIPGVGPETADAILLYAGKRPTFVVDAYTRRILRRHAVIDDKADYETIRRLFHRVIRPHAQTYNELHALFVRVGKLHCQARARCETCPLADLPHNAAP